MFKMNWIIISSSRSLTFQRLSLFFFSFFVVSLFYVFCYLFIHFFLNIFSHSFFSTLAVSLLLRYFIFIQTISICLLLRLSLRDHLLLFLQQWFIDILFFLPLHLVSFKFLRIRWSCSDLHTIHLKPKYNIFY